MAGACGTMHRDAMNPAEFPNIARAERDFWWYRGMREVMFRLLDQAPLPREARVLEAGCGTGYFSKLLERKANGNSRR